MNPTQSAFQQLSERYLRGLYEFNPNAAARLGLHDYDGRQPDLSGEAIQARLGQAQAAARQLAALNPADLDADERFDYRLLEAAIDLELYQWEAEQDYRRNPIWYLRGIDVMNFLTRDYAPLEERMRAAISYLRNAPRVLQSARENLLASIPRPFVEVSLESFEGMLLFYEKDLPAAALPLKDDTLILELDEALRTAAGAVSDFIRDLRERYAPQATNEFAIGAENFARMLKAGEMVDVPLETLVAEGERDLARNLAGLRGKAKQIDPDATIEAAAGMLKREHPAAGELIFSAREMLEEIRQFLIDSSIVSVPSEVRALVEETPAFMRWSLAMMMAPGPFEKVATEAYYYLTPPNPKWSPEQQAEWLSSYNLPELLDISVHEVYPGHYVQGLHTSLLVKDRLRQALTSVLSYAFTEGWAHYCEEMMLDAGYGEHNPRLRLAQLLAAALRDCRFLCAIRMHTQGMTVDAATRFFMQNALLPETAARKEALRGTFDPGYLFYTLGKLMILKLREDVKTRRGTAFNLKQFHDDLLSYGAPPVPLVREAMLGADGGSAL